MAAKNEIAELQKENEELKAINGELVEALKNIIASWDESMRGDKEVFKESDMLPNQNGYWSPAGAIIKSETIAMARIILSKIKQ